MPIDTSEKEHLKNSLPRSTCYLPLTDLSFVKDRCKTERTDRKEVLEILDLVRDNQTRIGSKARIDYKNEKKTRDLRVIFFGDLLVKSKRAIQKKE
ncbi:MAG: hypothetical protein ACFFD4_33305 [Candidatus Odinarchaeota archaeon]